MAVAGDLGPLPDGVWVHVDRVLIAITWSAMTMVRRTLLARTGVALAMASMLAVGCTSGPAAPPAPPAAPADPAFAADLRPKITALMGELSVPGAIVYVS